MRVRLRTYSSLNSSRQRLGPNSSGFPSLLSVGNTTSAAGSTLSMRPSPGSSFSLLAPPGSPNAQSMAHLLAPRHSISGSAAAMPTTTASTALGPPSIHIPTPNHSFPRKADGSTTTLAVPVDGAAPPSTSSPSSPTSTGPRSSPSGTISKGPLVSSLTASTSVLVSINGLNATGGSSASLAPPSASPATGPPPARKYSLTSIAPGLLGLRLPTFLSPIPSSGASAETIRTPSAVGSPMSGSAHGSNHSVNHPGGSGSAGGAGSGGGGGSGNDGLLSAAGTAARRRASFSGAISSLSSPDAAAMAAAVARVAGSTESAAGAGDARIRIIPPELHVSDVLTAPSAGAPPVVMPATPIPMSNASSLKRHGSSIEVGGTGDRNKGPAFTGGPRSAALVLGPHAKTATIDSKLQMARFAFEVREKLKQVLRGPDGGTVGGPDSLNGSSRASLESASMGSAAMVAAAAARVPLVVPEREDDEVGLVQRVPSPYPQHRAVGPRSASPSMPSLARRGVTSPGSSGASGGGGSGGAGVSGASGSVTAATGVSRAESRAVSGDVTTAAASDLAASSAGARQAAGTLSTMAGVTEPVQAEARPAPLAAGRARRPSTVSIVVVDTDAAVAAASLARAAARPDGDEGGGLGTG
ncbi:hypothetical protein AMAG_15721 [Allomyces macrogynus ATCC 38327]|uniref:Uncharacterized protein n=1 Tax=Allomyces macrogynus (strain ATCC 38327) TaxID=578462 RepID=A0A0L0TAE9_ALLM3|nr:hypothetical protein AMAG_15721 [Allomyces macrogynus ATCC 38327]|eukprot:KNE71504.1 hypothetical protein AMAG_15721 [Allomyces macrogynus ATCC 38327]